MHSCTISYYIRKSGFQWQRLPSLATQQFKLALSFRCRKTVFIYVTCTLRRHGLPDGFKKAKWNIWACLILNWFLLHRRACLQGRASKECFLNVEAFNSQALPCMPAVPAGKQRQEDHCSACFLSLHSKVRSLWATHWGHRKNSSSKESMISIWPQ